MADRILALRALITVERLREVLHYDPATGVFRWISNMRHAKAGCVAGCKTKQGYWQIKIDGRVYRAHRLVWLYIKGEWPGPMMDHEKGGGLRNELENLRPCTGTQNNGNIAKHVRNKSGFKGVYKNGKWSTWVARIGPQKRRQFLGCFADPRSAAAAYDAAAVRLFGEFARTNKMLGLLP